MPGTVTFKPLEVNLTKDTSLFGRPDPYCVVSLGNQKIQAQISEAEAKFPSFKNYPILHVIDEPTCLVELKDQENPNSDSIGACQVSLDEIESKGSLKRWYSIYNAQDQTTGKILLEATFTPENQTPTDLPASPEDILVTPEDKLMSPEESDEEMRLPEDPKRDDLLEEQLSPVEIEFPVKKKGTNKKGRQSLKWVKYEDAVDSDGSNEEFKTDLAIDLQKYKPRLSVVYKSHPLEMEDDESPTRTEPAQKKLNDRLSKSGETKKTVSLRDDTTNTLNSSGGKGEEKINTPGGDGEDIVDLYRKVMGTRWDV